MLFKVLKIINRLLDGGMIFFGYHVMLPTYSSLLVKNGRSHESGLHLIDVIFWPMRKQHINERSYILAYILRGIVILQAYHRQCRAEGPQVRVFVKPSTTRTTPANLSRLLKISLKIFIKTKSRVYSSSKSPFYVEKSILWRNLLMLDKDSEKN